MSCLTSKPKIRSLSHECDMNSIVLFSAVSLMLVGAIVIITLPNTAEADKPITKYCIDGGSFCGDKKTDCKTLLEGTTGDHKCLEVIIG